MLFPFYVQQELISVYWLRLGETNRFSLLPLLREMKSEWLPGGREGCVGRREF